MALKAAKKARTCTHLSSRLSLFLPRSRTVSTLPLFFLHTRTSFIRLHFPHPPKEVNAWLIVSAIPSSYKVRYPTDTVPIPHASNPSTTSPPNLINYPYSPSYATTGDHPMSTSRQRQVASLHPLELPSSGGSYLHSHSDLVQHTGYVHHTHPPDLHTHSPSFTTSAYSITPPIRFASLSGTAPDYSMSTTLTYGSNSEKSPSSASTVAFPQQMSESPLTAASGGSSIGGPGNPSTSPVIHTSPTDLQPSNSSDVLRPPVAEVSGATVGGSSGAGVQATTTGGRSRQSRKEVSSVVIACRQWSVSTVPLRFVIFPSSCPSTRTFYIVRGRRQVYSLRN